MARPAPGGLVEEEDAMQTTRRFAALVTVLGLALAACSSGASPTPAAPASVAPSVAAPSTAASAAASAAPSVAASATPIAGGLLDLVTKAGTIRVSTDPNYAPQSVQNPDGSYSGFDIDVATEIAKRMGLKVAFITPSWDAITSGGWGGRWDMSVGSMTITTDRQKVVDFSPPYYYTPAQFAASKVSGITTIDGFAGKTVCAGASTTYYDWLTGKKLDFGTLSPTTTPPAGVKAVTQKTDADCAQLWAAGRNDWQGWLTAGPTVEQAIKQNQPVVKVGAPVYFEPLAVALDKSGPNDADFLAKLTQIVKDMHADGTLKTMSMKWYGLDLTSGPGQ
jgi:polar amino acid transport system substrate-binding protein